MSDTKRPQFRIYYANGGTEEVSQTPTAEVLWERRFDLPISMCAPSLPTWRVEQSYYLVWACTDRKIDFDEWCATITDVGPVEPEKVEKDNSDESGDDIVPLDPTPEPGS